jgi:uncharacterized membrane protein HdeD (DUF308 family)
MNKKRELPNPTPLSILGFVLIILGVVALAVPALAGEAVVIVIGVMLVIAGVLQIISGVKAEQLSDKLPHVVLGVISGLCGLALLGEPWIGMKLITLILAIAFVVEGVWKIIASFRYRPAIGWFAMLASGVVSLLLGLLIWYQWPLSGLWAVGILVGVNLLITGVSLLAVSTTVRGLTEPSEPATEAVSD